jgi:hypothetical protein
MGQRLNHLLLVSLRVINITLLCPSLHTRAGSIGHVAQVKDSAFQGLHDHLRVLVHRERLARMEQIIVSVIGLRDPQNSTLAKQALFLAGLPAPDRSRLQRNLFARQSVAYAGSTSTIEGFDWTSDQK